MLKAVGILSTSALVKGIIVNPRGIDVPDNVPVLDSRDVRNPCLGYLESAWVAKDSLFGQLALTGRAVRRAFEMIERQELTECSCRFKITNVTVHDADGTLEIEEALDRLDDPSLFFIAQRSSLQEVSLTAMPSDPGATVACLQPQCRSLGRDPPG